MIIPQNFLWVALVVVVLIVTPLGPMLYNYGANLIGIEEVEVPTVEEGPYYGALTIRLDSSNFLTGADKDGTSEAYTFFHKAIGYSTGGIGVTADSTTTVDISPEDDGKFWLKCYGGTDAYIAMSSLTVLNPRIEQVVKADVDNNAKDEIYALVDVSDIGVPGQAATPVVALAVPLVTEDVTWTTSADDSDGEAATAHDVTITWSVTGLAASSGVYVNQIYFVTNNQTYEGELITFKYLRVTSPDGTSRTFDIIRTDSGYYSAWFYEPADYLRSYTNGFLVTRGSNDDDITYFKLTVLYDGTVGGGVDITGHVKLMGSEDAATALTLTASEIDD